MNVDEPIVIPDLLWTKQKIWDQLDRDSELEVLFEPKDISDNLAIEWVRRYELFAIESALVGGEEEYVSTIEELNEWLVQAVTDSL